MAKLEAVKTPLRTPVKTPLRDAQLEETIFNELMDADHGPHWTSPAKSDEELLDHPALEMLFAYSDFEAFKSLMLSTREGAAAEVLPPGWPGAHRVAGAADSRSEAVRSTSGTDSGASALMRDDVGCVVPERRRHCTQPPQPSAAPCICAARRRRAPCACCLCADSRCRTRSPSSRFTLDFT